MNTIALGVVLSVLMLDQVSKFLVLQNIEPGGSVEVIRGIFSLTLICNSGAAFGILKNQTLLFTLISILSIVVIIVYYVKLKHRVNHVRNFALALITAGALGNLIDRLRFGYVVDFLDFKVWPVFNIADSAITIGAFLLFLSMLVVDRSCPNT
ncbi:MAG: signal peptidase II [Candidatus Omnitrophota bacterium]